MYIQKILKKFCICLDTEVINNPNSQLEFDNELPSKSNSESQEYEKSPNFIIGSPEESYSSLSSSFEIEYPIKIDNFIN